MMKEVEENTISQRAKYFETFCFLAFFVSICFSFFIFQSLADLSQNISPFKNGFFHTWVLTIAPPLFFFYYGFVNTAEKRKKREEQMLKKYGGKAYEKKIQMSYQKGINPVPARGIFEMLCVGIFFVWSGLWLFGFLMLGGIMMEGGVMKGTLYALFLLSPAAIFLYIGFVIPSHREKRIRQYYLEKHPSKSIL